jgi:hypothetical protein
VKITSNGDTQLIDMTPPAGVTADPRLAQVTVRRLLQHLGGWTKSTTTTWPTVDLFAQYY